MVTLNPKLTGALAWLGLAMVVAVPSADFLAGGGERAATSRVLAETPPEQRPAAPPRTGIAELPPLPQNAAAATGPTGPRVVRPASRSARPVDRIETAATGAAARSQPIRDAVAPGAPTLSAGPSAPGRSEVATLSPAEPIPYPAPLARRPRLADFPAARPGAAAVVRQPLPPIASIQPIRAPRTVPVPRVPVGMSPFPPAFPQGEIVTSEQLQEWDSGSLADYLERRKLMSADRPAEGAWRRRLPAGVYPDYSEYDPDGFWLSEGPNAH